VTFARNGKSATLVFSGYNTPQPLPSTAAGARFGVPMANCQPSAAQATDYRAIMVTTLTRGSAPRPIHDGMHEEDD
jgi:hypothetical protein